MGDNAIYQKTGKKNLYEYKTLPFTSMKTIKECSEGNIKQCYKEDNENRKLWNSCKYHSKAKLGLHICRWIWRVEGKL